MSEDNMVERVAMALRACLDGFSDPVHFYVRDESRGRWLKEHPEDDTDEIARDWELESYKIISRAAIETMRESTEAMKESTWGRVRVDDVGIDETTAEQVWRVMIAVALQPKE